MVLFAILALTAVQSARLGTSRFLAQMAQSEFDRWSSANAPVDLREVSRVEKYLWNSLRYGSDNPWALGQFAALDLARMRASADPRAAVAAAQDARTRLRHALRERPTSPFLWANLALAKLYLDEVDDEFFNAFRHADEFGPWEPAIQQMTVFAGLAVWGQLNPELRQVLARTIERGALHNAGKVVEIVKKFRRFDLICAVNPYNQIVRQDCERLAATARAGKL